MSPIAAKEPVCLYLETTNRCNLLCTTCPRTYADLEPEADMSWELFTRIVDQVPNIARVVLHGVGEPMLVKDLPRMIRYLKDAWCLCAVQHQRHGPTARKGRELCDTGLDELRVSLDAANARTFVAVRGKDYFNRIVRNVRAFTEMQEREKADPRRAFRYGLPASRRPLRSCAISFASPTTSASRRSTCSAWCFSRRPLLAWRGQTRRSSSGSNEEDADHLEAADVPRAFARASASMPQVQPSRREPRTTYRQASLVAVPSAMDADVFYRQRSRAAVLHRAVLADADTRTTRWAMPPRQPCAISGTVRPTKRSAPPCSRTRLHTLVQTAACGGVSRWRSPRQLTSQRSFLVSTRKPRSAPW